MRAKLILSLFLLLLLSGCSWIENFVITNNSDKSVNISYTIDNSKVGFKIFDAKPRVFLLEKDGKINWEKEIQIVDTDTSKHIIKLLLPSKSIAIIGELTNDTYKCYNQEFINNRIFNLKKIRIITEKETIISPETFDSYFVKHDGLIDCKVSTL